MADQFEDGLRRDFRRGLEGQGEAPPTARWATHEELNNPEWERRPGSMFLGYRAGRRIGRSDDRHVLTVAGSRAGKGTSLIIPNLLLYEGSVMAIDPKGELARITRRHREQHLKQRCIVLDPFNANGRYPSAAFNPMAEIDPASKSAVDDAGLIADALIVDNQRDPYWTDSAKQLLHGLILFALSLEASQRTLVTVRRLLTGRHPLVLPEADDAKGSNYLDRLWWRLEAAGELFEGIVASTAARFSSLSDKEMGSILSSAISQTAFLDSPALARTLSHSDFSLSDLKAERTTVYLCLPASRMATHARWLRVMVGLALAVLEQDKVDPAAPPVLLLLEEFNVLGHMHSVEVAAGQIAGFGVRIWTVLQDLTQLQRHYDKSWETFIGNAGLITAFGNSDITTLKYLSEKLGTRTILVQTASGASLTAQMQGARAKQESLRVDPLMSPSEIELAFARETERMLVLHPGSPPVVLQRADYATHPDFSGMFDAR